MKKICVIGLGYIGLPTACILAKSGYDILGVDVNDDVINLLNSGNIHIEEEGLRELFKKVVGEKRIKVSKNLEKSDIFIISVPTPLNEENKADLSYIIEATKMIKDYIQKGNLVILESTSPPGTTRNIVGNIIDKDTGLKSGKDYYLSYCPERVMPGKIVYELVNNTRIIGGINRKSAEKAKEVYEKFVEGKIYLTTLEIAELVKLAENTYRDVNIAFSNELSLICSDYGVNVWDVIKFANMHPRVNILNPGPGVGGHCIPIDPWFMLENINRKDTLIEKSRNVNNSIPFIISNKILEIIKEYKNPKVTFFGLSYKENVGDIRESPAIAIYNELIKKGINVSIFDPLIKNTKYKLVSLEDSLINSDLLLLLTAHKIFNNVSLDHVSKLMRNKNIFDTRNFFNKDFVKKYCFKYFTI
ncbi:UDP-N-acetyl-D-mannosamine dehydrogenase [subsurface metagenome]